MGSHKRGQTRIHSKHSLRCCLIPSEIEVMAWLPRYFVKTSRSTLSSAAITVNPSLLGMKSICSIWMPAGRHQKQKDATKPQSSTAIVICYLFHESCCRWAHHDAITGEPFSQLLPALVCYWLYFRHKRPISSSGFLIALLFLARSATAGQLTRPERFKMTNIMVV